MALDYKWSYPENVTNIKNNVPGSPTEEEMRNIQWRAQCYSRNNVHTKNNRKTGRNYHLLGWGLQLTLHNCKVNKKTHELIQSDPHQDPNPKRNEKYNKAATKWTDGKQRVTLTQKGGDSVTQT